MCHAPKAPPRAPRPAPRRGGPGPAELTTWRWWEPGERRRVIMAAAFRRGCGVSRGRAGAGGSVLRGQREGGRAGWGPAGTPFPYPPFRKSGEGEAGVLTLLCQGGVLPENSRCGAGEYFQKTLAAVPPWKASKGVSFCSFRVRTGVRTRRLIDPGRARLRTDPG